jgi:ADP-ribosylation factor GTPase-activating protein 2/3
VCYLHFRTQHLLSDGVRFPAGIVVDGVEDEGTPTPTIKTEDEDFFTSWDKPTPPRSGSAPSSKPVTPAISRSASPAIAPAASVAAAPRTVTSSSLRAGPGATGPRKSGLGGASRLSSSSATTTTTTSAAPKKAKLGGLGGVKKVAAVDFEEAERKAAEEAERIKQLGYDRQREEEEEAARKEAEKARKATELRSTNPAKTFNEPPNNSVSKFATAKSNGNSAEVDRLGMGLGRLGFGGVPAPAAVGASATASRSAHEVMLCSSIWVDG